MMEWDESSSDKGEDTSNSDALLSQNSWNALRSGSRKSAFLPYKPSVTVLTNLQRGNTEAHTPVIESEELNFHQRAAQGDLTIKDIEQEPNIDEFDEDGLTPLMWASAYGQFPIVAALLQSSANVDLENPLGQTALLFASFGGYHEIVRILLLNGADVNHRDECGNTALMYAAQGNNPHTTNELLSKNANFTAVNANGDTAYSIAVKSENYVVQQVIENHLISLLTGEG
ncbi:UNVERIFIED_CONTAM: hypothetical protein PYX00_000501 [Menopon gallinae]|uniref:Ankyrin repeat family A protein 2 n=1 Tax=Menopon gallinae TaxID=328185 RepID=A0AAW2IAA3_9NEOP